MNILIIGTGYVGLTTGLTLAKNGNAVTFFDVDDSKIDKLSNKKPTFFENGVEDALIESFDNLSFTTSPNSLSDHDVMFVCVPTPEKSDGSSDLKYIDSVISDLVEFRKTDAKFLFVVKSTVPVGTNKKIQNKINDSGLKGEVASNPEFLSQGTAMWDSLNPNRIVIGTQSKWAKDMLDGLFANYGAPIVAMSLESAELVKYASNTFQALKVSFVNEMANISEAVGADVGDVANGMSFDPVIGNKFLRSGIGYGGSCFPKDTKSLSMQAKKAGVKSLITDSVIDTNKNQLTRLSKEASKEKGSFGILGLTFKPGTDDTRETPAHYIIQDLNSKGIVPSVYDPQGIENFKRMFPNDKVNIVSSSEELISSSDNILLVTEWDEFKQLNDQDFKGKKVFDGRRIYDFAYYQIGRGYK